MKTRKNRRHIDPQKRETPFFSKKSGKPNVEAQVDESFFRPKLIMGKPGDRFEQEADRAADHVVNGGRHGSNDVTAVRRKAKIQRQAEEKEEPVEAQAEEKKEEPVKAQAEEKKEEPVEAQAEEKKEEPVEAKGEEEEETRAKPAIQLQAAETQTKVQANPGSRPLNPNFAARLRQRQGKGRPLPDKIRAEMESSLDADFSAVRIHTDEEAAELSKMLKAQAFTRGNDIFFNQGKFDPETRAGKHLLAHELTHTKQQKNR